MVNDLFDLSGKVAIVTGASSGLGTRFAKALANAGANITIVARRIEKLEELKVELEYLGIKCLTVKCDVLKEDDIINAVERTIDEFGKIDILVNNAGTSSFAPAEDMTREEWDKVLGTNLTGVFLFSKHVARKMKERNYGRIINIASMYGVIGNTQYPVSSYHASKGGVVNLTRALAGEWAQYGITVNAIGPGFFESEMTRDLISDDDFQDFIRSRCPMERIGKPGELDGLLIYLSSDNSSYMTGQHVCVDGGWAAV
ncbi:SDR family NAD(P)-dependent oxidoreductase [Methanolobus halotolerans]|uniref:Short-chain dehydrogenase n=1 Tax=Methanolobus halotolerans TaxID=2052935 RepID=A0A4E0QBU2_9EURY|nr:glucose 1-dehydrogenase [Methanolobus halotolerans]TGC10654.1 short-chain dehydrogenase [Methanolobus halotolerans]